MNEIQKLEEQKIYLQEIKDLSYSFDAMFRIKKKIEIIEKEIERAERDTDDLTKK